SAWEPPREWRRKPRPPHVSSGEPDLWARQSQPVPARHWLRSRWRSRRVRRRSGGFAAGTFARKTQRTLEGRGPAVVKLQRIRAEPYISGFVAILSGHNYCKRAERGRREPVA